jgi:hypothetical protein
MNTEQLVAKQVKLTWQKSKKMSTYISRSSTPNQFSIRLGDKQGMTLDLWLLKPKQAHGLEEDGQTVSSERQCAELPAPG